MKKQFFLCILFAALCCLLPLTGLGEGDMIAEDGPAYADEETAEDSLLEEEDLETPPLQYGDHGDEVIRLQKRLAEHFWGSADAVDAIGDYKPTNKYKMIRAKWSIERKELHDMLSFCNWMGPWISTPNKQDGYMGDNSLESKYYRIRLQTKRILFLLITDGSTIIH